MFRVSKFQTVFSWLWLGRSQHFRSLGMLEITEQDHGATVTLESFGTAQYPKSIKFFFFDQVEFLRATEILGVADQDIYSHAIFFSTRLASCLESIRQTAWPKSLRASHFLYFQGLKYDDFIQSIWETCNQWLLVAEPWGSVPDPSAELREEKLLYNKSCWSNSPTLTRLGSTAATSKQQVWSSCMLIASKTRLFPGDRP